MKNKSVIIKIIVPLLIILLPVLGWFAFLNIWTVKSSNEIKSITLSVLKSGGYSDVVIADEDKISEIRELVSKLQKGTIITNMAALREAEKYQKDPQFTITFEYGGNSQEICVHKNTVVIFNDSHTYFLQLENMDTEELRNTLYSYSL